MHTESTYINSQNSQCTSTTLCILETNNGSEDITINMDCFGQENSEKLLMLHFHLLIQVKDSSFIMQFLSY